MATYEETKDALFEEACDEARAIANWLPTQRLHFDEALQYSLRLRASPITVFMDGEGVKLQPLERKQMIVSIILALASRRF